MFLEKVNFSLSNFELELNINFLDCIPFFCGYNYSGYTRYLSSENMGCQRFSSPYLGTEPHQYCHIIVRNHMVIHLTAVRALSKFP